MALNKVKQGDSAKRPSASTYNAFIDAVLDARGKQRNVGAKADSLPPEGLILIQNNSGADVDAGAVLGIDVALTGPIPTMDELGDDGDGTAAAKLRAAKDCPAVTAVTPTEDHHGKFVIVAEPIAAGKFGKAFVFGICFAKVDIKRFTHAFADITAGSTDHLTTAVDNDRGAAQIIAAAADIGIQWALVRLGNAKSPTLWQIIGRGPDPHFYYARRIKGVPTYVTGTWPANQATVPSFDGGHGDFTADASSSDTPASVAEVLIHNDYEANAFSGDVVSPPTGLQAGWGLPFSIDAAVSGEPLTMRGMVVEAYFTGCIDSNTGLEVHRCNVIPPRQLFKLTYDSSNPTGRYVGVFPEGSESGGFVVQQGATVVNRAEDGLLTFGGHSANLNLVTDNPYHCIPSNAIMWADYSGYWDTTAGCPVFHVYVEPGIFEVTLTTTDVQSTHQGDPSTPASYKYDVYCDGPVGPVKIGHGMSPLWRWPKGPCVAATKGLAAFLGSPTFFGIALTLIDTDERSATGTGLYTGTAIQSIGGISYGSGGLTFSFTPVNVVNGKMTTTATGSTVTGTGSCP